MFPAYRNAGLLFRTLRPRYVSSEVWFVLPTSHLALRAAYLLEPSRVGAFRGAFEEVRQARPYLRLLLSGPWPPYSFVTPQDTLSSVLLDRLGASTLAHVMR